VVRTGTAALELTLSDEEVAALEAPYTPREPRFFYSNYDQHHVPPPNQTSPAAGRAHSAHHIAMERVCFSDFAGYVT
jgi:hypothetical protein